MSHLASQLRVHGPGGTGCSGSRDSASDLRGQRPGDTAHHARRKLPVERQQCLRHKHQRKVFIHVPRGEQQRVRARKSPGQTGAVFNYQQALHRAHFGMAALRGRRCRGVLEYQPAPRSCDRDHPDRVCLRRRCG